MYHLTCPSCQNVTDSPFVRSGAVVRCPSCENKYRIKSSHFDREIHTGPRTVDETDTILRSDSVDIDPDEVPPVSIDDEGNVVGLSGLSELMRWSDAKPGAGDTDVSSAVNGRTGKHAAPLPRAMPAASSTSSAAPSTGRARAQAMKRRKRNKMLIMMGVTAVVVIGTAVIIINMLGGDSPEVVDEDPPTKPPRDETPVITDGPAQDPGDDPQDPTDVEDPSLFVDPNQPEPNPESLFVAPWLVQNSADPPADVPTMLTPTRPLVHEGWYVMAPPRGPADASGVSNVELGQLVETDLGEGTTLLSSTITNSSPQMVMKGELHIMLLDGTSNVFAETYVPLAMIGPRSRQLFAMTIPTRYWKRARGTRAAVLVQEWTDPVPQIDDVRLQSAGQGLSTALRVSVKNDGDKALRGAMIYLTAINEDGNALASFLVEDESLYVRENHWLDLVLATPLHPGHQAAQWTATVVPK